MISNRPYLLRAFYEWISDSDCTPYIVVSTVDKRVIVPEQYVSDEKIVLNIAAQAVQDLAIHNDAIEFDASFQGVAMHVYAPMRSVMAIYARENGRGMVFSEEDEPPYDDDSPDGEGSGKKGPPKLRVVK